GSDPIKLRDCAQNLAAMPQPNAQVLEVLLRQIANDREVNGVSEALGVLSQADRCEPLGDVSHGTSQQRSLSGRSYCGAELLLPILRRAFGRSAARSACRRLAGKSLGQT